MLLRVFRFSAKDDYEFYYKPYEIELCADASIADALAIARESDRYLPNYGEAFWLKINGVVVHSSAAAAQFVRDGELMLQPLSERLAREDFLMDQREFEAVYEHYFAPIFGDAERANYRALEPLFYATCARESKPEFMGDSALVFAALMMDKFPEKSPELKRVVFSEFGIDYAQDLRPFLHEKGEYYEGIKNKLKAMR